MNAIRLMVLMFISFSISATPWERFQLPSASEPHAIGSYANGCLAGAHALPLEGEGYQVLRSQRGRYYAHPDTIDFIERLARTAQNEFDSLLLIGDLSLPLGGRFSSGHSSHQTGLDADIWLRLADYPLSDEELNQPVPVSLVNLEAYRLHREHWQGRHFSLVKRAAQDESVARIFVHPVIKQKLCDSETSSNRDWLRKVRPWWGHHYHMHVRLNCPYDSELCTPQIEPPIGDGCGSELASWRPKPKTANEDTPKAKKKKRKKIPPALCLEMLEMNNAAL
ncbi:penicillin-insensitive murein endopeptidase [Vibrio sonorensis]|uniref:penicillin-insensitive murein endopeptidase n=1 Tax=Vibrio sonorensis TaxID=1004316 RepID=UPI0008DB064E|nr:penicillin-insensitive murein endopeptidase [Vibrio sonorensis]